MTRSRVLIADDHSMVVEGLRVLLEPEYEIVGTVADGRAVLPAVKELKPHLVIIDISMPSLNGLDCARLIQESGLAVKTVILTMHPDPTLAREALQCGASAYVLKSSPASELRTALREALQGRTFLSPAVTRDVLDIMGRADTARDDAWARLTPRQREVLQLLAEGKAHKEIAALLNVSVKTVEYHKYAILDALGLKTNAELVQYAIRHGIISV